MSSYGGQAERIHQFPKGYCGKVVSSRVVRQKATKRRIADSFADAVNQTYFFTAKQGGSSHAK